jgi:hypothetical protein
MPRMCAGDRTELFYRDWGAGRPVVFTHSMLVSSDMRQHQRRFTRGGPKHPPTRRWKNSAARCAPSSPATTSPHPISTGRFTAVCKSSSNGTPATRSSSTARTATAPARTANEVSMLALHLLQSALVHINTLLLQAVLAVPEFHDSVGPDERRALTRLLAR